MKSASPLAGLYVHVPFCTSVCPYCDFAVTIAGTPRRTGWARAVVAEAALYSQLDLEFDTIYFGGGTPSSLLADRIAGVLTGLRRELTIANCATLHLEANPEDVTADNVAAWRDFGVGFVSLGVQSLDDAELAFLGRRHSASQALAAVDMLVNAGFSTVSVDLMFGLPGQRTVDWQHQLEAVAGLGVHHLSCYQLTIHHETVFGRRAAAGDLTEMDDERQGEIFLSTHRTLARLGFEAYEVSNFARDPRYRSRHNQKYWNHTPYLGLGPSAHSLVDGTRWWNRRKVRLWQADIENGQRSVEGRERPSPAQLALETVMLGLRTTAGLDLEATGFRLGCDLRGSNRDLIASLVDNGYLIDDGQVVRPTLAGLAVADAMAARFEIPTSRDRRA